MYPPGQNYRNYPPSMASSLSSRHSSRPRQHSQIPQPMEVVIDFSECAELHPSVSKDRRRESRHRTDSSSKHTGRTGRTDSSSSRPSRSGAASHASRRTSASVPTSSLDEYRSCLMGAKSIASAPPAERKKKDKLQVTATNYDPAEYKAMLTNYDSRHTNVDQTNHRRRSRRKAEHMMKGA